MSTKKAAYNPYPISEWIRLPPAGQREPNSGLSRAKLNQLILPTAGNPHPPVRSVSVRLPHQSRGVRLIHLPSLLEYLQNLESKNEAQPHTCTSTKMVGGSRGYCLTMLARLFNYLRGLVGGVAKSGEQSK